jgi:hypothetical protein
VSDERGAPFTRVFGGRIDIGAVEYEPAWFLAGDYNGNGIIDAVDFTVWRDALDSHVTTGGSGDGNGDGIVNQLDYDVWRTNFGATLPASGGGGASGEEVGASGIQTVALPGIGEAARSALEIETAPIKPRVKSGAGGVLAARRPFNAVTRQDLLFASWIVERDHSASGRDHAAFDRLSSDAATDNSVESDIATVDSAFALLSDRI